MCNFGIFFGEYVIMTIITNSNLIAIPYCMFPCIVGDLDIEISDFCTICCHKRIICNDV